MNKELQTVLRSPDKQNPLIYDNATRKLIDKTTNTVYEVLNGVPVLLPQNVIDKQKNAAQHQDIGSDFTYADHYQKDAEYFDYFDEYEDGATRHENKRLHQAIVAQISKQKTKRILDVGCGNGWVAKTFCPDEITVFSMDISTVNPLKAKEKYPYDNHHALVADVYSMPFQKDAFDCVVDNEKLHYSMCIHCNHPTPRFAHLHSFDEKKLLSLSPLSALDSWKTLTFNNNYLIKLRSHIFMQYFPYQVWRFVDSIVNRIVKKPNRLMLKLVKK